MNSIGFLVTNRDITGKGITVKTGTVPDDNYCRTKDYISTNFNVDTAANPYSSYTTNRYPRYQDVVGICPTCVFATSLGSTTNCTGFRGSATATQSILIITDCGNYEVRLAGQSFGTTTTAWQSGCCQGGPYPFTFNTVNVGEYKVEIRPQSVGGTTCASWLSNSFKICCDTGAWWINNGSTFCSSCNLYQPQYDYNMCSSTCNQTRNVDLGVNDDCGSWTLSYYCPSSNPCDKYSKETNSCTGNVRNVTLIQSNSTYCGGCCGQSTTANWVNNGSTFCSEGIQYQPQVDNNSCSSTYNQTRNVDLGYQLTCCGNFGLTVSYNSKYCNGTTNTSGVVTLNANASIGGFQLRLVSVGSGVTTAWQSGTTFTGVADGQYYAEIKSTTNEECIVSSGSPYIVVSCYVATTTTTTSTTTTCAPTTYYALNACSPATGTGYTTIAPGGINQRYVLPFPTTTYYTYGGTTLSSCTPPGGYNASIQISAGNYNCP